MKINIFTGNFCKKNKLNIYWNFNKLWLIMFLNLLIVYYTKSQDKKFDHTPLFIAAKDKNEEYCFLFESVIEIYGVKDVNKYTF